MESPRLTWLRLAASLFPHGLPPHPDPVPWQAPPPPACSQQQVEQCGSLPVALHASSPLAPAALRSMVHCGQCRSHCFCLQELRHHWWCGLLQCSACVDLPAVTHDWRAGWRGVRYCWRAVQLDTTDAVPQNSGRCTGVYSINHNRHTTQAQACMDRTT